MTLYDGEFRVYMVPFPGTIHAAVRLDQDGFPSIYINDWLAPEARRRAFDHEMRHLERDDFYNDKQIREVEKK
ncbi:MAG: hypothetical protein IIZ93_15410 [Acidaminococcaceae bacterium]|nr:hypothetical protein [Acidaminococcaceae bacterium]